jgi:hypothetical protein
MNKSTRLRMIAAAALAFAAVAAAPEARAAKFANQFVEFELPPQWSCNLEGAEWVCQSTDESKKRDAIIVLAAKLKGDQDSLDQYQTYLSAAKTYTSVTGKPVKSEVKYPAKTVNLNGQAWVDSLHLESEIPGFYTRYLATVKQDIGVLVTYSVAKAKYANYTEAFENMIKTLKVFRKPGAINTGGNSNGTIFSNTTIPAGAVSDSTVFGGAPVPTEAPKPKKPKSDNSMLLLLAVGVVVVIFVIRRKKQG